MGCAESEVGRRDCEAQSEQRAGPRLWPCLQRTRAAAAAGPWGREPGAGRRWAARGPDCRLYIRPARPRVTTVLWARQLEKWEVRLGKLGWLTWCCLDITNHTSSAGPEIHSVSTGSHFLLWGGGVSANAFLPQFPAPVCAARRRLRLFIINDAACPHHYDDNYYYCCDFGLRGESCRRRESWGVGLQSDPASPLWPPRSVLCAGVAEMNLET